MVAAVAWHAATAFGADRIYWAGYGNDKISFANLDGSGGGGDLSTAGATISEPLGIAIDIAGDRILWANDAAPKISFASLAGSGGADLNTAGTTTNPLAGIAVYPAANKVYWGNLTPSAVAFANLDDSGGGGYLDTSGASVGGVAGVAVDPGAGRIYWSSDEPTNKISFANLDGSGSGGDINTMGATVNRPFGVAVDPAGGRIYWANNGDSTIGYANLDGSGGGDLSTTGATVSHPNGVAIDHAAGRIYWASFTTNKISYANLDGSGGGGDVATTGATVNGPAFPALLKTPVGTGAPEISGGAHVGATLACSEGSWAGDLLGSFLYRVPRSFAYQWKRNGSDIAGATARTHNAFQPGSYTCRVTATNQAGSTSQTSAAHAVKPPNTRITKKKVNQAKDKATFRFRSIGRSSGFQCKLKRAHHRKPKARFRRCESPKTYKDLKPGSYTFKVRAVYHKVKDPTPARKRFRIES